MIKTLKHKTIYENKWVRYNVDEVEFPSGETGEYAFHERADAGPMIIPQREDGKFLVLKEWRYPIQDWSWGFPVGGVELGETFLQAAQRELEEETGYVAQKWIDLGTLCVDPGGSSQVAPVFFSSDLVSGIAHQESGEIHEVHFFTADEIEEKICAGEFRSSWLLAGWCKLQAYLKNVR